VVFLVAILGPSWGHLGAILGPLGAIFGHLGAMLANVGAILEVPAAILGPPWGNVGPTYYYLLLRTTTYCDKLPRTNTNTIYYNGPRPGGMRGAFKSAAPEGEQGVMKS